MNQDESPQAITWTITSTDEELLMQTDSQWICVVWRKHANRENHCQSANTSQSHYDIKGIYCTYEPR